MLREEMAGRDVRGQKKKDKDDPSEQKISGFVHINLADGNSKKIPYSAPPLSLRHRNPGYKAPMQKINKALVTLKDKKIESIELEHKSGVASVYQLAVESPDEKIPPRFKNELAAAQDAKIEYGGVIVSREKNTDLTDLIKGLTLELKGASDEHVTITVRVDVERAQKAINEFLEQYNKFLSLADRLSVQAKEKNLGKYDRQKKKSGVLSGDSTLNRLVTELQRMASSAYPNKTGKDKKKTIRVLYQIGISTGKIGGSIQKSMRGRLEIIDQQKLVKQLRDNHEAVEEFFGSDTTGNKQVNHGLAFRMWTYLRHYTRRGRSGMITVKINMTEKRIENTRKRIRKLERHVAMYKKRLKRSFQAMEQGMLQLKSERRWLQNQMKGLSGGGGGSKGKVNLND
jgi:flagellar hook-associated protein 2